MSQTPIFLLPDPITTSSFAASSFLPPTKPSGRRWALRKILTGARPYPKHSTTSLGGRLMPDPCSAQTQSHEKPRLAGCSLGRVPRTFPANAVQFCRGSLKIQGLKHAPNQGTAGNVLPWGGRLPGFNPVCSVSERRLPTALCKCTFPYKTKWESWERGISAAPSRLPATWRAGPRHPESPAEASDSNPTSSTADAA